MREGMNRITVYIIVTAIFFLLLFLSVSAPMVVNDSDFSIYNTGWNGCSDLAVKTREMGSFTPNIELAEGKRTEVTQRDLTEYEVEAEKTSMIIMGPSQEFSEESIEYVDEFLRDGGKLLLADDFGSGNTLLDGLETDSSFHSTPLLDFAYEKKPELGVVYNFEDHVLTENVSQVMLNSPTAIDKSEGASTLMRSSEASWLDRNENRMKDEDETFDEYPLMTVEDYGDGELILVSDPSIFINSMQERKDNSVLSENILNYLSSGRSDIIFDESHREMSFVYRMIYTGNVPGIVIGTLFIFAGFGIGIYLGLSELRDVLFQKMMKVVPFLFGEQEKEDPVGKMLNNHPDWDKDKLEMINERLVENGKGDG